MLVGEKGSSHMRVLNLVHLGAKGVIMFPQVNRQYLCLPNLNTLNVLLGTLNQVWLRITVSSLLHKQVLFSPFNALTVNRFIKPQDCKLSGHLL